MWKELGKIVKADQDKKVEKNRDNVAIGAGTAQAERVQQHGEAASQMIQAKTGLRVDSVGQALDHHGRNLDQIHQYSLGNGTPKQQADVAKSQAGFSAELIKEARDNKEAILQGNSNRTRTTDGIGRKNDPQYDHVSLDKNNNVIPGSESQMKFYGVDAKGRYKVIEKIVNDQTWSRYEGRPIDVPSDQYDGAVQYAKKCAENYRRQAQRMSEEGNKERSIELLNKSKKYEAAAKQIRSSNVSASEAIQARMNPDLFVAKEVIRDSHHAGMEAAKAMFIVSGSISIVQNIYALGAGEREIDEAVDDVVRTTMDAGLTAYGVGCGGTMIKAVMHSSESQVIRNLGTTGFPQMVALAVIETGKSMKKYISGDIDEETLLLELGEKGTGMLAGGYGLASGAAAGAAIGSIVPVIGTAIGSVVGGIVGSMVGSSTGSVLYRGATEALHSERISEERRQVVEFIAQKAVEENKKYQDLIEQCARDKYYQREIRLHSLFKQMDADLLNDNLDAYVKDLESIGRVFDIKLKFASFEEFDDFMRNPDAILVLD